MLKQLYGSGVLFFYFLKWPYVFGFAYLYMYKDLTQNYILNILWFYCLALIIKDFVVMLSKRNKK